MTTYTSYDFEKARFAFHPSGRVACARLPHSGLPWTDNDGDRWGNGALVRDGWVPVQENPLTDAAIKSLVAKRERALVRKIREAYNRDPFPSALRLAAAVYQGLTEKPRPEGASEIESQIEAWSMSPDGGALNAAQHRMLADYLAAHLADPTAEVQS